jgi:hypothetical protein
MPQDPPLYSFSSFLRSWSGVLPPDAVVMGRRSASVASESVSVETRTGFLFVVPDLNRPECLELWEKVLGALSLEASEYRIVEEDEAGELATSERVIVRLELGPEDEPRGWSENAGVFTLSTYSLGAMIDRPALKKPVWEGLKEALKRGRDS